MTIPSEFIEKIKCILEDYPRDHSINSLRNAFDLLSRAKKLSDIDSNAAVFLAITAEEEAVSSIFLALKQLGYDCSDKINHRNHIHKVAFYPFCQALSKSFEVFEKCTPQLVIDKEFEHPILFLRFFVEDFDGKSLVARPAVPFGFSIKNDICLEYFEDNLKLFFGEHFEKLKKCLKDVANKRNQVLYASPNGIPKVKFNDAKKYFYEYENKINALMLLYFLIAPYKEKQIFVQQALHAFVKMLGEVPDEKKY